MSSTNSPLVGPKEVDLVNSRMDIHVVALMRIYEQQREIAANAEETMKAIKEQLKLGLGAIADLDHITLDPNSYGVEIRYPSAEDETVIEKWSLTFVNRTDKRLNAELLLAAQVTPQQIAEGTKTSNSQFVTVKKLK